MPFKLLFVSLLMAASIAAGASSAGAAEEKTVRASSAWAGNGRVFQVGEDQALFLGAFEGTLFVETAEGALDAAALVCPGSMTIKLSDRTQSGEGRCVLTGRDGDRVFAEWRCSGVYLQGCRGDFRLTGGTGKFAGIAGQGDFVARTALGELTAERGGGSARQTGIGLAAWPALHYTLP